MSLNNYSFVITISTLGSLVLRFLSTYFRILFLIAGFLLTILKFLFSLAMTILSPIYYVVSPIVSPMIVTYLTFMTSLNAGFGNFLQPLLAHVPWLTGIVQSVAGFISPIRFVPALQVIQGIFILAAVPYIAAAAVGIVMFVHTFGARLIINGGRVVCDYFFADSIGTNARNRSVQVTHKYPSVVGTLKNVSNEISNLYNDRYNAWDRRAPRSTVVKVFLISLQCASLLVLIPIAFLNRLITFSIKGFYGVAHAFSDACTATKDAFNATLDIPLLRIMRRPFATVDKTTLKEEIRESSEPVNNKAHKLDNEETVSNQATNTPRLDSEAEINMNSDYRLSAAFVTPHQNRTHMQPCLVEISQRKSDTSIFREAKAFLIPDAYRDESSKRGFVANTRDVLKY